MNCDSLVCESQPEDIVHIEFYRRDALEHDDVADIKLHPTHIVTIKEHRVRDVATGYLCRCVCVCVCVCSHARACVCVSYLRSHLCQSDDLGKVISDSNA